jgi:hypothetical protein
VPARRILVRRRWARPALALSALASAERLALVELTALTARLAVLARPAVAALTALVARLAVLAQAVSAVLVSGLPGQATAAR